MATVGYMGPYYGPELGPGKSAWIEFGESQGFSGCALAVTASAHRGRGGDTHVLRVDNVYVTLVQDNHSGDNPINSYFAGCRVTNDGTTSIVEWSVLVGVIAP